jgi:hypothetical protein
VNAIESIKLIRPSDPPSSLGSQKAIPPSTRRRRSNGLGFDHGVIVHLLFRKRNICAWRTDNPNQLESAHEIRF